MLARSQPPAAFPASVNLGAANLALLRMADEDHEEGELDEGLENSAQLTSTTSNNSSNCNKITGQNPSVSRHSGKKGEHKKHKKSSKIKKSKSGKKTKKSDNASHKSKVDSKPKWDHDLSPNCNVQADYEKLYGYCSDQEDSCRVSSTSDVQAFVDPVVALDEQQSIFTEPPVDQRRTHKSNDPNPRRRDWKSSSSNNNNKSTNACKYWQHGFCHRGAECGFSHSGEQTKKTELCKFYGNGNCYKGDSCGFMHSQFPCKYFHRFHGCREGLGCKFSHLPLSEEMAAALDRQLAAELESSSVQHSRQSPDRGTPSLFTDLGFSLAPASSSQPPTVTSLLAEPDPSCLDLPMIRLQTSYSRPIRAYHPPANWNPGGMESFPFRLRGRFPSVGHRFPQLMPPRPMFHSAAGRMMLSAPPLHGMSFLHCGGYPAPRVPLDCMQAEEDQNQDQELETRPLFPAENPSSPAAPAAVLTDTDDRRLLEFLCSTASTSSPDPPDPVPTSSSIQPLPACRSSPVELSSAPWSLEVLHVIRKVPYPLMQLPADLPHALYDPRLRGALDAALLPQSTLQLSCASVQAANVKEECLQSVSTNQSSPPIKSEPSKPMDPRLTNRSSAVTAAVQSSSSSSTVEADPTAAAVVVPPNLFSFQKRIRLTLNENSAALFQPQNFTAVVQADVSPPRQTDVSSDRSYLMNPRFKRRKASTIEVNSQPADSS